MASKTYEREVAKARRATMKRYGGRMPTAAEVEASLAAIVARHEAAIKARKDSGGK